MPRKHIEVRGVVQGVGFRPFVYRIARDLSLSGCVFNTSAGVTIEAEGSAHALRQFLNILQTSPPPLAQITDFVVQEMAPKEQIGFSISHSNLQTDEFALISTDTATCDACWNDVTDPANRRYGYPFTNCTHCGPRYSIVRDIPYDRQFTTMSVFRMCAACAAEYADPTDRRFHAQPNACGDCGPQLAVLKSGEPLSSVRFEERSTLAVLQRARDLLREGQILAIKGLGGFLLACDATNEEAVRTLRTRKRRPAKPFAIMVRDVEAVNALCQVSQAAKLILGSTRRPIVLLPRRPDAALAEGIANHNENLGIMLPYTPLHYLLFGMPGNPYSTFAALVMTSGNFSEEPIITSNEEAVKTLSGIADCFLIHNRDIAMRVDDSVVQVFEGRERVMRRSRGYAPQAIDLGKNFQSVLGLGADLKNTLCLTRGRFAILSQHIGDLQHYETEEFLLETLSRMQHLFRVQPYALAHDMHPRYRSTRIALNWNMERKFAVQHHHAHVASCMAENHLEGKVIGVAFDGTGFGTDGKIWGGEFLIADMAGFRRFAHLRYVSLPGGDAAVHQPWRAALSYLRDTFGPSSDKPTCFNGVEPKQLRLVDTMLAKGVQTVETSSAGRLFDAVATLVGIPGEVTFEGEAAVALEAMAASSITALYPFELTRSEPMTVDLRAMIAAIVADLHTRRSAAEISARFHNTVSAAIVEVCTRMRVEEGLGRVCLSGGTFQNLYLLERTVIELRRRGFDVYLHATVPSNDGGISLGQAAVASELLSRGV